MRTSDLDYRLPRELIAQVPAERRAAARLLELDPADGPPRHRHVADLPALLRRGDLVVMNDTRVLRARLHGRRATGGAVEMLLVSPSGDSTWQALMRCGGSPRPGELVRCTRAGEHADIELVESLGGGVWRVRAGGGESLPCVMNRIGKLPLPPYIRRERDDPRDATDLDRYQTVFAREPGAVAAPTAGLHIDEAILAGLAERGVRTATVTLHVGIGTFAPVRSDDLADHDMHSERFAVPTETAEAIREVRAGGGRVVAVGTTTVRALEASSAGSPDELPTPGAASTDLFIVPGHRFRVVDALLTNFHLPRSTLLALVWALAGRKEVQRAYETAVRERYRFYSYGDSMFAWRREPDRV